MTRYLSDDYVETIWKDARRRKPSAALPQQGDKNIRNQLISGITFNSPFTITDDIHV
jgi:hypothetical protein